MVVKFPGILKLELGFFREREIFSLCGINFLSGRHIYLHSSPGLSNRYANSSNELTLNNDNKVITYSTMLLDSK